MDEWMSKWFELISNSVTTMCILLFVNKCDYDPRKISDFNMCKL